MIKRADGTAGLFVSNVFPPLLVKEFEDEDEAMALAESNERDAEEDWRQMI